MPYEERAISPVVGVILMVSITVILAAVIAAYVFGLAGAAPDGQTIHIEIINVTDRQVMDNNYCKYPVPCTRFVVFADNGDVYLSNYTNFVNLIEGWHTVETRRDGGPFVAVIRVIK